MKNGVISINQIEGYALPAGGDNVQIKFKTIGADMAIAGVDNRIKKVTVLVIDQTSDELTVDEAILINHEPRFTRETRMEIEHSLNLLENLTTHNEMRAQKQLKPIRLDDLTISISIEHL